MNVDDCDFYGNDWIVYYNNIDNDFCVSEIALANQELINIADLFSTIGSSYNHYNCYFHHFHNNDFILLEHIKKIDITNDTVNEIKLKYCEYLI